MLAAASISTLALACNAILDNKPGALVEPEEAGRLVTRDASRPAPAAAAEAAPSDAGSAAASDVDETPSAACSPEEHLCASVCVSRADPLYGCGDPSCARCPSTHGAAACRDEHCVVSGCDPGYADCNAIPSDGCETDLSKPTSCGGCNVVCGEVAPLCEPDGPAFRCTNGCAQGVPLRCGADCVDPQTNVSHCGACTVACPLMTNAASACAAGACTFTCSPGFADCDAVAANGCETSLAVDPLHCGLCGHPCGLLQICVGGACLGLGL